jgi:nicotinate-nucleotide pyrophosphorylase (carboxylating)
MQPLLISENIKELVALALKEDLGAGDITSEAVVSRSLIGHGFVKAKSSGVLCGEKIFDEVFRQVDPSVVVTWTAHDGQTLEPPEKCLTLEGPLHSILVAERTALNFIQRMSGVATLTKCLADRIRHTSAKIIDTRKTTPLWRALEKYAVRTGGGTNHRMGLYDMYLIKDNHITSAGGIAQAIRAVLRHKDGKKITIEVETKNMEEVKEAVQFPIDRIMLDNMSPEEMKTCVSLIAKRCEVEASGGVTLESVKAIAETGVDFISVGALTHSAPAMDFSLIIE